MTASRLTPNGYRPRLIEPKLDALMQAFGCVEINGPRWCGKTWTAMSRAASLTKLDSPSDREAARLDPSLALLGEKPHLIDEWQEVPEVWDAARRAVDDSGNTRGMLLLTGSTALSPANRPKVHHSGTGRIVRLSMLPMTLFETGDSTGEVSLASLFDGKPLTPCRRETSLQEVARWCCRGGWPANLGIDDDIAQETAAQYIQSVTDVNVIEDGRSPETALALMNAVALNLSQAATLSTLAKDMGEDAAASANTLKGYLDLLDRLKVTEQLGGWEPPMRSKARVRVKPKRYFSDPSLAAALLGATPDRLLRDTQALGMLFENLVIRDLRVFLSTYRGLGNALHYYRDEKGLEVDVVIEHANRWAGIEIKLSDSKANDAARNLLALKKKVLANPAAQNAEPAFLAAVVGKGALAYTRDDGVMVIPAATLTA